MKKIPVLILLILPALMARAEAERSVFLLFTQNGNGALSSCDCPSRPFGGMTRRAAFFREFKKKHPYTVIVSAGDELGTFREPVADKYVFKALQLMQYDIFAVGDQELVYPPDYFLSQQKGLPFLCANLFLTNGQEPVFPPCRVIEKNGVKILFIGIAGESIGPLIASPGFRWKEYREKLSSLLDDYRKKTDFIVLVSHSGLQEDMKIAAEFTKIDLIVGAHSGDLLKKPRTVSGVWIVQAGKDSQYVGKIEMSLGKKKVLKNYECVALTKKTVEDAEVRALILQAENEFREKASRGLLETGRP